MPEGQPSRFVSITLNELAMHGSHREHKGLNAVLATCPSLNFPVGPADCRAALESPTGSSPRRGKAYNQIAAIKLESAFNKEDLVHLASLKTTQKSGSPGSIATFMNFLSSVANDRAAAAPISAASRHGASIIMQILN